MSLRVGIGYDVHRLVVGRKLVLGGTEIPHERGLAGHSDADVVIHAIIDALLGAGNLGNIGQLFPDTDPQYKDISSILLLERVSDIIRKNRWELGNLDVTVVMERPKLAPHVLEMQKALSQALQCDAMRISIKAKTTERMGFTGREEGIEAYAVALIERSDTLTESDYTEHTR